MRWGVQEEGDDQRRHGGNRWRRRVYRRVGLKKEDALNRVRWREGVREIAVGVR